MAYTPKFQSEIGIRIFVYLRHYWWVILLIMTAALCYGFFKYHRTPPVFGSAALLLIDSTKRQIAQSLTKGQIAGLGAVSKKNVTQVLGSPEARKLFRKVLVERASDAGNPSYLQPYVAERGASEPNVSLSFDEKSDLFNLACYANHPQAALEICSAYIETIEQMSKILGLKETYQRQEFLREQIKRVSLEVEEMTKARIEFERAHARVLDFIKGKPARDRYKEIQADLIELQQTVVKNEALKRILLRTSTQSKGEDKQWDKAIQGLMLRLNELRYRSQLLSRSQSPERQEKEKILSDEIEQVSEQLKNLNTQSLNSVLSSPQHSGDLRKKIAQLEVQTMTARATIPSMQKQLHEMEKTDRQVQSEKLEYSRIETELKAMKRTLSKMLIQREDGEIAIAAGGTEISRLNLPTLPEARLSPYLTTFLPSFLLKGLLLCVLVLATLIVLFPRIYSEEDVKQLGLPTIGRLPFLAGSDRGAESMKSEVLEHLKMIHFRLLRETKDIKCPIILITSANPNEGKSTLSELLTLASQSPGRKTLLIDGDIVREKPSRFFKLDDDVTPGLAGFLNSPTSDLSPFIAKTIHEGIHLLPRGRRAEGPMGADMLASLAAPLNDLRRKYDFIVIDSPPLLASHFAVQWSAFVNLAIMVARLHHTTPKSLREALTLFSSLSTAPVGIVCNNTRAFNLHNRNMNYYYQRDRVTPQRLAS